MKAKLILANGEIFEGHSFGEEGSVTGEIVFTTAMTGYQETLTDPSYCGQIVTQTFPLIGNYGTNRTDYESGGSVVAGYIVREHCKDPSNFRSEGTINAFLKRYGIIGLYGIDTRKLTRIIRETGVMNGKITTLPLQNMEEEIADIRNYTLGDVVPKVSVRESCTYPCFEGKNSDNKLNVVLIDYGYKHNILRKLRESGCGVTVVPWNTSAEDIIAMNPRGIMLSNGPGDPSANVKPIQELQKLMKSGIPIFGICLGHQLAALASGAKTFKLKYGHRGGNQPVTDLALDRTFITSQNHGYAVDGGSIDTNVCSVSHINANDKTCEGIRYKNMPVFTVQFHPEAFAGPHDTAYLFDDFVDVMKIQSAGKN